MAGMSFGQAQEQRLRLANDSHAQDWQKINNDYQLGMIDALKQNGVGAAKPATAAAPAKTPTFSNISVNGASLGVMPSAFGQASPTSLPINEGMPGSGVRGRTLFSTDAAGKVTIPARAGYQTTGAGLTDVQDDGLGANAGTLMLRKGITKVKDRTGNGSPTKDTVDAKLAEGEAVLNAGAAKIVGREGIAALNERGLKEMGMEGAAPEFVDGEVRAYSGIDFNDPAMKANAQNMEMRRRLAAGVRQPVVNPSLVESAPIQATPVQPAPVQSAAIQVAEAPKPVMPANPAATGLTNFERTILSGKNPNNITIGRGGIGPNGYASGVQKAAPVAAKQGILGKIAGSALGRAAGVAGLALYSGEAGAASEDADFAPGGKFRTAGAAKPDPKSTGESMTPGDAMLLRRPAEPQYSQQVPVPAGYVPPKAQVFAARGVTKEDRSNYDLAEQGFGGVVRKAGNVYTDAGKNPYLDQQFKEQDGLTGAQLMERRIATDTARQAEMVAKEDKAQLDALEAADPRVRIARIEKEGTTAQKKAEQDAAVNLAREQNPKLTKAQEMAIRYGVKDAVAKDGYKVEMNEVTQALGEPAVDEQGKPLIDVMSGRRVVNPNKDAERKFFAWMSQNNIKDTNQGLALYMANYGGNKTPSTFASAAEVEAAAKAGQIKAGDKVVVNGRAATWQ